MTLEEQITELVARALTEPDLKKKVSFALSGKTIGRIQKDSGLDLTGYACIVDCDHIRHVNKGHSNAVPLICKIPQLINNYHTCKKNIIEDRRTRQPLVNLIFTYRLGEKYIQLVQLRVFRDKEISLKTMFVKE